MTRHSLSLLLILLVALLGLTSNVSAQDTPTPTLTPTPSGGGELVASLETLKSSVSVRRAGTEGWVRVLKESLVGVGDSVRTDLSGSARITFFANGTDTIVEPASEFRIDEFSGSEDHYTLSLTVVVGQTTQRVAKLLDSGSSYTINSTGLELAVRGTTFAMRVEDGGRSSLLVQTGLIATQGRAPSPAVSSEANVPAGYGVRGDPGQGLSDVVPAASFAQLDSALDGCEALIVTLGDVQLNVRTGPGLSFPRIGQFPNRLRQRVIGVTETTKWYRIRFKDGYAWVFAPALQIDKTCPGLRRFPDSFGPEDFTLYQGLDPQFMLSATPPPILTPTPTP